MFANSPNAKDSHPDEVRIAFDGDAVLFSDQAERVFQERGLPAFEAHEKSRAGEPLPPGPLQPFLRALHVLQRTPRGSAMRIRTALGDLAQRAGARPRDSHAHELGHRGG